MDSMESMTMATAMTMTAVSSAMGAMTTGSMNMPNMPSNMSNATSTPKMPSMEGMDMSCRISMLWNWFTIDACFLSSSWHIRSHGMFAGSCIGTICLVVCLEFLRRMGREFDAFILRRARIRQMNLVGSTSAIPSTQIGKKGMIFDPKDPDCSCDCPQTSSAGQGNPITTVPGVDSSTTKLAGPNSVTPVAGEGAQLVDGGMTNRKNPDLVAPYRPSPIEQVIRALLHMVQFAVAYIIMLLAMYYNGYIIICIFIGAFLGSLIFSWEPLSLSTENDATQVTKCCG